MFRSNYAFFISALDDLYPTADLTGTPRWNLSSETDWMKYYKFLDAGGIGKGNKVEFFANNEVWSELV
jgi:hypothetical protein